MIFSNNIYYHYRIRCDVLSSKTKSYLDGNTTTFYTTPIYEEANLHVDYKKFKSKKQALEYCQKLIEQGFLEKKVLFFIERFRDAFPKKLLKNKNLRIEKWRKYKFNPNNDILPHHKEEKISEFKVAL